MSGGQKLKTFQFLSDGVVISPILTTTREYGRWMTSIFDNYTCQKELEMHTRGINMSGSGTEWHPGTKIGDFFSRKEQTFVSPIYKSWYVAGDCAVFTRLQNLGICERGDIIPFSTKDKTKSKMLRLYSMNQIELYLRTVVDASFSMSGLFLDPRNVSLHEQDLLHIIIPEKKRGVKRLFDRNGG